MRLLNSLLENGLLEFIIGSAQHVSCGDSKDSYYLKGFYPKGSAKVVRNSEEALQFYLG